jgi:hypothetical protein
VKIFSVDAETDGLYGKVWAIGAAVLDGDDVVHTFGSRLDSDVITNPWVRENVVPAVVGHIGRVESREDMLNAFWRFWLEHRQGTEAVADFEAPVEAGLFRACVELNVDAREWLGPYPLHELATALFVAGIDPDIDRRELCKNPSILPIHNPLGDAVTSGRCWHQIVGGRP